jgi:hypothetical protein
MYSVVRSDPIVKRDDFFGLHVRYVRLQHFRSTSVSCNGTWQFRAFCSGGKNVLRSVALRGKECDAPRASEWQSTFKQSRPTCSTTLLNHASKRNPHLMVIHWDGRSPSMNRLSRFKTICAAFQTCARSVGTMYCMISVSRASAEHRLLLPPKNATDGFLLYNSSSRTGLSRPSRVFLNPPSHHHVHVPTTHPSPQP